MPRLCETRGRTVLPPLALEAATVVLAPPFLPAGAAPGVALARRAAAAATPVLLEAPAGCRLRLARALHAVGGRAGPLIAAVGRRPVLDDLPAQASLYLDVGRLAPEALVALEALLDDGAVWVLAGLDPEIGLPPALAARLAAVVVDVAPLAARPDDLEALGATVLAELSRRRGAVAPRLVPAALARLRAYPWPGDVAELEAALARALLLAEGDTIAAEDLALGAVAPAPGPTRPSAPGGAELEFLLAELAHELRNPMVTIKTYARHLPALLEDAELRARFDTLTTEAIERMDGLLENVLAFARLGAPRPAPVEVAPLIARVVADMAPELEGRAVRIRQQAAPAARYAADAEHLAYALRNLFAGVVREVPAREELWLDAAANGVVTLRFTASGEAADRLRRLAAGDEGASLGDPTLLPLTFRLARAVLERNGGALSVVPEGGGTTTLVIRLPTAGADPESR